MTDVQTPKKAPSTWRLVLAAILDFFTVFLIGGYVIASIFGGKTDEGFNLSGMPALLLFAVIIAYFWIFNRFLGGTIWRHILRATRVA